MDTICCLPSSSSLYVLYTEAWTGSSPSFSPQNYRHYTGLYRVEHSRLFSPPVYKQAATTTAEHYSDMFLSCPSSLSAASIWSVDRILRPVTPCKVYFLRRKRNRVGTLSQASASIRSVCPPKSACQRLLRHPRRHPRWRRTSRSRSMDLSMVGSAWPCNGVLRWPLGPTSGI